MQGFANMCIFVIPWTYAPVASKLGVALQGNPPPTPLYAAHRFAQRGFPRRLGPFRVALTTLNGKLKALPMFCLSFLIASFFKLPNMILKNKKTPSSVVLTEGVFSFSCVLYPIHSVWKVPSLSTR